MRTAETILSIIRERGKRGMPLEDVYRQLFNPNLYLLAYANLYSNKGAMTKGSTNETVEGMSLAKIEKLINEVRYERHRWTPVRRVYIPKKNGKMRSLGLPTWSDKLLQEVIRLILEAYYEPQFSNYSYGFRPGRGCHNALTVISYTWTGTKWFIEGDIKQCFDRLDHETIMSILQEKIHDNRFLRLIQNLLKAGYLEDWKYNRTISGSPQGGVASPILSNIYLDKLDEFVEQTLLPQYNHGTARRRNPQWAKLTFRKHWLIKKGRMAEARTLLQEMRKMPSHDPYDEEYRRLRYVRYADDFLLGYAGTLAEAEEIKRRIGDFLTNNLKLELSSEKTLITHARTGAARFLGYEIVHQYDDTKVEHGLRSLNGKMGLRVPNDVIDRLCARYCKRGKIMHRAELISDDDYTIVSQYQAEYRGIVQYYLLATNVSWLGRLQWYMRGSLLKTLASKHKTTMKEIARKYQAITKTDYGTMKCLAVSVEREGRQPLITRFGGIPLRHQRKATLNDQKPFHYRTERNELIKRLLAEQCEQCGTTTNCEVHHIRKLADLQMKGRKEKPKWMQLMASRRRKTLVVCRTCHDEIHSGNIGRHLSRKSLESRVMGNY